MALVHRKAALAVVVALSIAFTSAWAASAPKSSKKAEKQARKDAKHGSPDAAPNTLTDQERKAGFKLLFDGKSTEGWRGYKKDKPEGWEAVDGALKRMDPKAPDLITKDQFEAFELLIDYKISPGGNSGIMFHVAETNGPSYATGPEIQVQDNVAGHDPQKSGWLYQLYKPDTDATKPAGQWNSMRILIAPKGQKSAVWMNGQKYYEFEKGSADWDAKVKASKFKDMPGFGKQTKGYICLQNHGDEVEFRNIKVRVIEGAASASASK
jgi:hypothetical protein